MGGPSVSPAELEDAAAVARVHRRSWQAGNRTIIPAQAAGASIPTASTERWRELLVESSSVQTLVARVGVGGIVGFTAFAVQAPYGDEPEHSIPIGDCRIGSILALYVAPEHWRQGIGRALLMAAIGRLGDEGCSGLGVWVLRSNRRARAFYLAMSFTYGGVEGVHLPTAASELYLRREPIEAAV